MKPAIDLKLHILLVRKGKCYKQQVVPRERREGKAWCPGKWYSPVVVAIINLLSKQSDYSIEKVANNNVNMGELEQTSLEVLYLIIAPK